MKLLGVDPGGTTGLALYDTEAVEFTYPYKGQLGPQEHHYNLFETIHLCKPDVVVCERFDYRRNLTNANLSPVEYIGVLKTAVTDLNHHYELKPDRSCKLVLQKQLKGQRGLWTDEKLKAVGLYTPAMTHRNDAIRQVLYYLTTELNDLTWINRYGESR